MASLLNKQLENIDKMEEFANKILHPNCKIIQTGKFVIKQNLFLNIYTKISQDLIYFKLIK